MNFIAHALVAQRCGFYRPDEILGSILPDVAAMAGARYTSSTLPEGVAVGVTLHQRTDEVFHTHSAFLAGSGLLREWLTTTGISTGAARAVAHAGWELLLDGTLVEDRNLIGAVRRSFDQSSSVCPALSPADCRRWMEFARVASAESWTVYADPAGVAQRLHARLSARPRLSFENKELPAVTAALANCVPLVAATAERLLSEVVTLVLGDGVRG